MPCLRPGLLLCLALCIGNADAQGPPAPSIAPAASSPSSSAVPSDAEIRQILINRIDVEKRGIGIVVGIIEPQGPRIIAYGKLEKGDTRALDGDTLFEIGSITKTFTALLLTDMAQRGEVKLDDPIAKYLPADVKVPGRNGRDISLTDLATHTSGLPRMPDNFHPKDPANPYADYGADQLYAFLSSYELPRDIGVKFEYSNLGFGLLGFGLARRAGTDYASLVESRICAPLQLTSTRVNLTPEQRRRFAAGHSADLVTVPAWDQGALAGAGALHSSANDLLTFLAANMGYVQTPLSPAMRSMLSVRRPTGEPFDDTALGWNIDSRGGGEIIDKGGATYGYLSFIGYAPRSRTGIVVLSNTAGEGGVEDIALHLLDARYPLSVPAGSPRQTAADPKLLDRYPGRYELNANFILTVTREGDQLFVQATGQSRFAVYPKSEREFFYKTINAQITFEATAQSDAPAGALVLHQNGRDLRAVRIDEATATQLEQTLAQRIKNQTAQPGSEAAIHRIIDQLQQQQPDYDQFTPAFASVAREQTAHTEALIARLGALQSLAFKGVGPGGGDIYQANFANGPAEWRILLDPDGKISSISIHLPP